VSAADEKKRERILTREEEKRLLEFCVGRRAHLRPVIICALDTGMRYGEIAKLTWADVDFFNKVIRVQALNTKTLTSRQVPITKRLEKELLGIWKNGQAPTDKVFGIGNTIKTPFGNAREAAGLPDLHFHDLRHTAATRMIKQRVPLQEVGRILGHTQANTTYRYVNANADTAKRAALALDAFNEEDEKKEGKPDELVN
jgi:integrase